MCGMRCTQGVTSVGQVFHILGLFLGIVESNPEKVPLDYKKGHDRLKLL